MHVRDIVRHRTQIWIVSPDTTVYRGLELMAEKDIGALPVMVDENLAGIFTEHDYARKCILMGRSSRETLVSELMTTPVLTIHPDVPLEDCLALMTARQIRYLPVIENYQLIGIVSIGDILRTLLAEKDVTLHELEGYITGYGAGVPV